MGKQFFGDTEMNKISKVSYRFSLLFKALIALYPLYVIGVWMGQIPTGYGLSAIARFPFDIQLDSVRLTLRSYACLVDMIPTAIVMCNFYFLVKLFQLYSENKIFSYQNVMYMRKIGYTLLLQVIAAFLIMPILSLIVTLDAPKNGHVIALSLGSDHIITFITGSIVILISWIMEEGRKLEEETIYTV